MHDLIEEELRQMIAEWTAGKEVRTIELGHSVRLNQEGTEEPHKFRQRRALDYCFRLIAAALEHERPISFETFALLSELAPADLSTEERQAAESLAWKALARGWRNAITGHADDHYLSLKREAQA